MLLVALLSSRIQPSSALVLPSRLPLALRWSIAIMASPAPISGWLRNFFFTPISGTRVLPTPAILSRHRSFARLIGFSLPLNSAIASLRLVSATMKATASSSTSTNTARSGTITGPNALEAWSISAWVKGTKPQLSLQASLKMPTRVRTSASNIFMLAVRTLTRPAMPARAISLAPIVSGAFWTS